jgi:hypothetical protein
LILLNRFRQNPSFFCAKPETRKSGREPVGAGSAVVLRVQPDAGLRDVFRFSHEACLSLLVPTVHIFQFQSNIRE